jgi:CPA2 family monovalent cation:H+ antiporter-2
LPLGARAAGQTLIHFALHAMGVRVVSLRRSSGKPVDVADDTTLESGDMLVLSGKAETLALAEQKLLKGA